MQLDRARVRGLHEVVEETLLPFAPGAELLPANGLNVDGGDPHHAILGEQRREAVVVAHHHRVGELAAQRLDLDAINNALKVAHWFPLSSVWITHHDTEVLRAHHPGHTRSCLE